ncbi:phosphatidylserine synthase [Clostridium acetobutylicum]|nr:phosphatidylserine synthase [Clostridium acetobutylicum]
MFIGIYNRSVIVTYMGIASAMVGMYLADKHDIRYAILCLVIAGVCDLFDGKVARMCKRTEDEKLFGIQLDSLADVICFSALPISIFYGLGLNKWYHVVIYIAFTLAAITRLGFFNIKVMDSNRDKPVDYYSGLPVTCSAMIFPLFWLLSFCLERHIFLLTYTILIAVVAFLFVANIKIKKPKGIAYGIFAILAVLMSLGIIFIGI